MNNRMSAMLAVMALAAGLAAGLPAADAAAGTRAAPAPSVRVGLDGLDLGREADAAVLYQRLKVAARRVCTGLDGPGVRAQQAWRECYGSALSRAVAASGSASLARLHGVAPAPVPLASRDGG